MNGSVRTLIRRAGRHFLNEAPIREMRIGQSLLLTCGIFALHSFLHSPIPGAGEPHYLSKARAFWDNDWCSRDFFLQSSNPHYWFYVLTGPWTQVFSFPIVAAAGRIVSLLLLACGWHRLVSVLRLPPLASACSAIVFCTVAGCGNFSGEWIVGGFESKVPAYAFGIAAMAEWIASHEAEHRRRRLLSSGGLTGCAATLHPVIGGWLLIAIGMAECSCQVMAAFGPTTDCDPPGKRGNTFGRVRLFLRDAMTWLAPLVVCSLPGVIPALKLLRPGGLSEQQARHADFIQVFWRLPHHLDPAVFWPVGRTHTIVIMAIGVLSAGLLITLSKHIRTGTHLPALRRLWLLVAMSATIAAVGFLIGWHTVPAAKISGWPWRASLLKFYPFRLLDALLPIAASLSLIAVARLVMRPMHRVMRRATRRVRLFAVMVLTVAMACVSWTNRNRAPAFYTVESYRTWITTCHWIEENTEPDTLFVTPGISWGFKWYARRAEYVCFKDCPQEATGILEWNKRLHEMKTWRDASYADQTVDETELNVLARLTDAEYLVTRDDIRFDARPVFRDGIWRIYSLSSTEGPAIAAP